MATNFNPAIPPRSIRADVRNPVLQEAEVLAAWASLPDDSRAALQAMLKTLSRSFHRKGDKAWLSRKPPMAAYWRQLGVIARHMALAANAAPARPCHGAAAGRRCDV